MPFKDPEKQRAYKQAYDKARTKSRSGKHKTDRALKLLRFIAMDGEDIDGCFSMFAASTGDRLETPGRDITMGEWAVWMMDLAKREKDPSHTTVYVGFSINYDWQRLMRTLSWQPGGHMELGALADRKKVVAYEDRVRRLVIDWLSHKALTLIEKQGQRTTGYVEVYDVFSFFQKGFVPVCREWVPDRQEDIARMMEWKARRGGFAERDRDAIRLYNDTENVCLVAVMEKFAAAIEEGYGRPRKWWGPGAIVNVMMRKHGMKAYHCKTEAYPADVQARLHRAFFGGRSQVLQAGEFSEAYDYDIVSAYPAAISSILPGALGMWTSVGPDARPVTWGVYDVEWDVPLSCPVTPFPYRDRTGSISYPHKGEGSYMGPEVIAAKELWGDCINVLGGSEFVPETGIECWDWYRDLANARARHKLEGRADLASVEKLGLNSGYGKMAQMKPEEGPWSNRFWAGLITSHCRATLLRGAMADPGAVIFMATDGLMTTRPINLLAGSGLGSWEVGGCSPLFVIQPGVYLFGRKGKTRGITGPDWEEMRQQWKENGKVEYHHIGMEFVGITEGLERTDPNDIAEWRERTSVYRSCIEVDPGIGNAPCPPLLVPKREPGSNVKGPPPEGSIPGQLEKRYLAARQLLGRKTAKAIRLREGIATVISEAIRADKARPAGRLTTRG